MKARRPFAFFYAAFSCRVSSSGGGRRELPAGLNKKNTPLTFWWWGEQEIAGLKGWLQKTVSLFEEAHSSITVQTVLQETEGLVDNFVSACASGNPPDLVCLWGGVYTMEHVFRNWLEPIENVVPKEKLKGLYLPVLSRFKDEHYSVGWYGKPLGLLYNRTLFAEAGIPESLTPPRSYDDFLTLCGMLADRGIIPLAAGLNDGFWGEWYFSLSAGQYADKLWEADFTAPGTRLMTEGMGDSVDIMP